MANIVLPPRSVKMMTTSQELEFNRLVSMMYGQYNQRAPMYPRSPYAVDRFNRGGNNVIDLSRLNDGSYGLHTHYPGTIGIRNRHAHALRGLGVLMRLRGLGYSVPSPAGASDLQSYLDSVAAANGLSACRSGTYVGCPDPSGFANLMNQAEQAWIGFHPAAGTPGTVTSSSTGMTTVAPPETQPTSINTPGISQRQASQITGKPNQSVPPNPQPGTVPLGTGLPQTGQSMTSQSNAETGASNIGSSWNNYILLFGVAAFGLYFLTKKG